MTSAFAALATFTVAFLALGRYKVLRDPASYWIGLGFASVGVGLVFYFLSWPGLLPDGKAFIGHSQNTAMWTGRPLPIVLSAFLLCAVLMRWPGQRDMPGRRWLYSVGAWLTFVTGLEIVLVLLEDHLPVLVQQNGIFTGQNDVMQFLLACAFAAGAVFSTTRYLRSGDALLAYVALCQIAYTFTELTLGLGGRRYDLTWYSNRLLLLSGFLVVMFGLLYDYVGLLRRERDRACELQAKSVELEAALRELSLDMDQRKQAEEMLIRTEKLAATGRLAATIAHEINNPLETMTSVAHLLQKCVADARAQEYVEILQKQLQTLGRIANQTLKFHRQNGQAAEYDLAEVVTELLEFYAAKALKHQVTVSKRIEARGKLFGCADEIRQVVSNLVINAIEATAAGGNIVVHLYDSADWRDQRPGYRLSVADSGCGVDRQHRGRIFEPFFTTKGEKGTGLGLWVSMGIVQRAGGSMRVWSTQRPQRSGTCFSLFLPSSGPIALPAWVPYENGQASGIAV